MKRITKIAGRNKITQRGKTIQLFTEKIQFLLEDINQEMFNL